MTREDDAEFAAVVEENSLMRRALLDGWRLDSRYGIESIQEDETAALEFTFENDFGDHVGWKDTEEEALDALLDRLRKEEP